MPDHKRLPEAPALVCMCNCDSDIQYILQTRALDWTTRRDRDVEIKTRRTRL